MAHADILVIGAGIIGASVAWRLAQQGLQVTLIDSGAFGGQASSAGAGMLAPGGEFPARSTWAELAVDSAGLYPSYVEELRSETGMAIDYTQCGGVEIARTDSDWAELQARAEAQRGLGIRSNPLDPAELREVRVAAVGALYYPDEAQVEPQDVMRALASACRARGVEVLEREPVQQIRAGERSVEVMLRGGVEIGEKAVLAAGAWSSQIPVVAGDQPVSLPACFPVKGHLVGYELPPGSLAHIVRSGHTYVLQRSSGFTVAGSSEERVGFSDSVNPAIVQDIIRRAVELLPSLLSGPPSESWIGFRPGTESREPVVHRLETTNLWLAYGHYRNGILLAPITAARLSAEIAHHNPA